MEILMLHISKLNPDVRLIKESQLLSSNDKAIFIRMAGFTFKNDLPLKEQVDSNTFIERIVLPRNRILKYALFNLFLWIHYRNTKAELIQAVNVVTIPAALMISKRKIPVLLDNHEFYPGMILPVFGKIGYYFFSSMEKLLLPRVDVIFNTSQHHQDILKRHYNVDSKLLMNCSSLNDISPPVYNEKDKKKDQIIKFIYPGVVLPYRGYFQLIEAVEILKKEKFHEKKPFFVEIVGDGPILSACQKMTYEKKLDDLIKFTGKVPYSEAIRLIKESSFGLILFEPNPNNCTAIANKLYDYLACGIPTIATNCNKEYRRVFKEHKVGFLTNVTNIKDIARVFKKCANLDQEILFKMKRESRTLFETQLNWEINSTDYLNYVKEIKQRKKQNGV